NAKRLFLTDEDADVRLQGHFGERDRDTAVGDVVAGGDPACIDARADEIARALLGPEVNGGRRTFLAAVDLAQPDRLAQMPHALAVCEHDVAGALEADTDRLCEVVDDADAPDRGGGQDGAAAARRLRFIVKTDVARHDRIVERPARLAHALQAARDLAHDFRALRIGEVEAV